MRNRWWMILAVIAFTLCALTSMSAMAAPLDQQTLDEPLLGIARIIYESLLGHHYFAAMAGALVLLTAILRRVGVRVTPWFGTDLGGTLLVFGNAVGGALLAAALGGGALSLTLLGSAVVVGGAAAGGYTAVKRLVITPLRRRSARWPAWLRYLFGAVAWIFGRAAREIPEDSGATLRSSIVTGVVFLAILHSGACASVRPAFRAGVDAALVCQRENLAGLAYEAFEVARRYLSTTIAGDGSVDTAAIRAAARMVRTDAGRCAFAAALAALAASTSGPTQMAGTLPSSYVLRRGLADIAREDWHVRLTLDGEALR